ncbi:hypothetical protein [Streptomyces sp. NPDC002790]|uniref:hypothetical protein n=1 Tax=Streptomyces sp. NPDC002790 TaxID=3154431 RepID=UPI00332029D8
MTPFITAKNSTDVASAAGKERPRNSEGSTRGVRPATAARRWCTANPPSTTAAVCPDADALHHYLTRRIALEAVTSIETAPVLHTYKAAATMRR